ncbi:MAG: hypothetical protein LCI02_09670 [Proteobacteria bacterium]|nr:hypothetical protein [Pseudomonadota bacterium]
MPEATQTHETTPEPTGDEVKNPAAVLLKNKELLARNAELQARVTELEGQAQALTEAHSKLQADFADFHIRRPLARVAEQISPVPDLWMAEFSKLYDVRQVGDDLRVFDKKTGEMCVVPEGTRTAGKPIDLTPESLWAFLDRGVSERSKKDSECDPQAARFNWLMRYLGPSGGGAVGSFGSGLKGVMPSAPAPSPEPASTPPLGLR